MTRARFCQICVFARRQHSRCPKLQGFGTSPRQLYNKIYNCFSVKNKSVPGTVMHPRQRRSKQEICYSIRRRPPRRPPLRSSRRDGVLPDQNFQPMPPQPLYRPARDACQHARARRSVAVADVRAVSPRRDDERGSLRRYDRGARLRPADGVHIVALSVHSLGPIGRSVLRKRASPAGNGG